MNTAKIAAFYPYFLDALGYSNPAHVLEKMLIRQLQCGDRTAEHRYSLTLTDMDNPGQHADWLAELVGVTIQEFTSARLYHWAQQQVPAWEPENGRRPRTGWHLRLQASRRAAAVSDEEQDYYAPGSMAGLTKLLLGVRAYQAKRRKLAQRLVRQLWAYHQQQALRQPSLVTEHSAPPPVALAAASARQDLLPGLRQALTTKLHQATGAAAAILAAEGRAAA